MHDCEFVCMCVQKCYTYTCTHAYIYKHPLPWVLGFTTQDTLCTCTHRYTDTLCTCTHRYTYMLAAQHPPVFTTLQVTRVRGFRADVADSVTLLYIHTYTHAYTPQVTQVRGFSVDFAVSVTLRAYIMHTYTNTYTHTHTHTHTHMAPQHAPVEVHHHCSGSYFSLGLMFLDLSRIWRVLAASLCHVNLHVRYLACAHPCVWSNDSRRHRKEFLFAHRFGNHHSPGIVLLRWILCVHRLNHVDVFLRRLQPSFGLLDQFWLRVPVHALRDWLCLDFPISVRLCTCESKPSFYELLGKTIFTLVDSRVWYTKKV